MKFAEEVSNLDWQENDESEDGSATQPGDPGETIIIPTFPQLTLPVYGK
jgi:hypothetical protein